MYLWLIKIILAHLLTDFVLQPRSWVESRRQHHFASPHLYLHGGVTALVAWLLVGLDYWLVALVILITHTLIDGWKSYRPDRTTYFLIDQALHGGVLLACWYATFLPAEAVGTYWNGLSGKLSFWGVLTGAVFLTFPSAILIGQLTRQWRMQLPDAEGLANAGKWIGIIERLIILILVLLHQYEAIGLLIAAKSILRFNEQNRPEVKTEYLVIGTLISISLAVMTGIAVDALV